MRKCIFIEITLDSSLAVQTATYYKNIPTVKTATPITSRLKLALHCHTRYNCVQYPWNYGHCLANLISKILTFRLEICFNHRKYIVKYVEYLRIMASEKYYGVRRIEVIWKRSAKASQVNGMLLVDQKTLHFQLFCSSAQGCTYLTEFVEPAACSGSPFWDLWICA